MQLKINQVLFLWLDHLNNVFTMSSEEEILKVRDTLKDLMNNPDWPLQLIVSGIPDLLPYFHADKQLRRRFRDLGKLGAEHVPFRRSRAFSDSWPNSAGPISRTSYARRNAIYARIPDFTMRHFNRLAKV